MRLRPNVSAQTGRRAYGWNARGHGWNMNPAPRRLQATESEAGLRDHQLACDCKIPDDRGGALRRLRTLESGLHLTIRVWHYDKDGQRARWTRRTRKPRAESLRCGTGKNRRRQNEREGTDGSPSVSRHGFSPCRHPGASRLNGHWSAEVRPGFKPDVGTGTDWRAWPEKQPYFPGSPQIVTRGLDPRAFAAPKRLRPRRRVHQISMMMDGNATRACPSCASFEVASRVNPTCDVKSGHDELNPEAGFCLATFESDSEV